MYFPTPEGKSLVSDFLHVVCFDSRLCYRVDDVRDGHRRWWLRGIRMLLLPVDAKSWALREVLPTYRAYVWPDARMRQKVDLPAGGAGESFAADMARIGFLARVRPDVLPKGGLARQFHPALFAHVLPLVLLHVAVEVLLGLQLLLAEGALKPSVLHRVIVILVEVEGDLVGHFGAAHVADAWLPVVGDYVLHVISFHPKHSVALVAGEGIIDGVLAHNVHLQWKL